MLGAWAAPPMLLVDRTRPSAHESVRGGREVWRDNHVEEGRVMGWEGCGGEGGAGARPGTVQSSMTNDEGKTKKQQRQKKKNKQK